MKHELRLVVATIGLASMVGISQVQTAQAAETQTINTGIGIRYQVNLDLPKKITVGDQGKVNYQIKPVGGVETTGTVDFHAENDPVFEIKGDTWRAVRAGETTLAPETKLSEKTKQLLIKKYGGYSVEDVAQIIPVKVEPKTQSVYRLYNPQSGEHFYTTNGAERDQLAQIGWNFEGTSWQSYQGGIPIYRVYNPNAGDHHYTLDKSEVDHLVANGWRSEGISFYSADSKNVGVYRVYNPNAKAGAHHYTLDQKEQQALTNAGWQSEGISWYEE